jgi:AcrR family transcriptional regulator
MGDMAAVQTEIKAERRRQILDCAKQLFSEKGFHNASVSDIVDEAGIARGTFYLYFTGKRDIFDSLLDDLLAELRRRIKPIDLGEGSPDPLDQVKANIRRVLELVIEDPNLIQILLHHAAGLDQRSAELLRTFYDRVLTLIERSLEHGIRLGLVRPCHTRIVAACILGTIKEVADWLTSRRWELPPTDVLVDEIIRFGLGGIFARPLES